MTTTVRSQSCGRWVCSGWRCSKRGSVWNGDILVTRTTSPASNLVLTLVGGLVTSEGGPMSHAAVLSRALGIPAIVGAADAMTAISDCDTVEIDPQAGTVRVVSG